MNQQPDQRKPPSTYRETFRRHRKLFWIPPILGALVAAFFLSGMGTTYEASASLWVDTAPPAPSSIGADSGPLNQPPASAEQAILNELMATRSFATSIVQHSLLGKTPTGATRPQAEALKPINQAVPGGQILQISYSDSSLPVAESVVRAVVAQLRDYTNRLIDQHNQAVVANDREQVKAAATAVATARSNLSVYQAQHPDFKHTDPAYMSLVAAKDGAVTQLNKANTVLGQVTGGNNNDAWSLQVIDPPNHATVTPVGKKKMAEVILGGILGGVLVSFLGVVALTPAKKEVWEDELPIGGPFGPDVPVAGSVRAGSPEAPGAAVGDPGFGDTMTGLDELREYSAIHSHFRTSSAPEEQ